MSCLTIDTISACLSTHFARDFVSSRLRRMHTISDFVSLIAIVDNVFGACHFGRNLLSIFVSRLVILTLLQQWFIFVSLRSF